MKPTNTTLEKDIKNVRSLSLLFAIRKIKGAYTNIERIRQFTFQMEIFECGAIERLHILCSRSVLQECIDLRNAYDIRILYRALVFLFNNKRSQLRLYPNTLDLTSMSSFCLQLNRIIQNHTSSPDYLDFDVSQRKHKHLEKEQELI